MVVKKNKKPLDNRMSPLHITTNGRYSDLDVNPTGWDESAWIITPTKWNVVKHEKTEVDGKWLVFCKLDAVNSVWGVF